MPRAGGCWGSFSSRPSRNRNAPDEPVVQPLDAGPPRLFSGEGFEGRCRPRTTYATGSVGPGWSPGGKRRSPKSGWWSTILRTAPSGRATALASSQSPEEANGSRAPGLPGRRRRRMCEERPVGPQGKLPRREDAAGAHDGGCPGGGVSHLHGRSGSSRQRARPGVTSEQMGRGDGLGALGRPGPRVRRS